MTGSPEPSEVSPELFDFVSLFLADQKDGIARPLEEYLARFPGHEAELRAEHRRLTTERATSPSIARTFGPYRILEQLGSGGQGTVLLAEDTRLHRRVALKILAPHLDFVSTERLQRFRREVEILAQLDHPGICSVYEADSCEQVPYLAMRYVEGQTLGAILKKRRLAQELPRTRAEQHKVMLWIETAAKALHEAHEVGVVHRDVKPGNLMITPEDQPVLLDFGLARHEHGSDPDITRTGAVLGTLSYMAPEVLNPRGGAPDRRVDVYALGVTLYECLTNRLPFEAESQGALWKAIEAADPADPRSINPALPRELAAVVLTALAKSPSQRYATALEFAQDLARVRNREPIRARETPAWIRAVRTVQRHPTLTLAAIALLLLSAVLAFSLERVSANERTARALNRAVQAARSDEGAAEALQELLDAGGPDPGSGLQSAMLELLDECNLAYQVARKPIAPRNEAVPALDPIGKYFVLGDQRGDIRLYDARTGRLIERRQVLRGEIGGLAFSTSGTALLTAGEDGRVVAWSVPGLVESHSFQPFGEGVPLSCLAYSRDGNLLAIGGLGRVGLVRPPDLRTQVIVSLGESEVVGQLHFSPDGSQVLVLSRKRSEDPDGYDICRFVSVADGRVLHELVHASQDVVFAEWHERKPALALAYNGGHVEVLNTQTWRTHFATEVGQEVHWCGFDPTGDLLLVPSDGATRLFRWDSPGHRLERQLVHPQMRTIGAAAWNSDHRRLATVHRDGTVRIYDTEDWRVLSSFKQRVIGVRFLRWSADGSMLLTADLNRLSGWHAAVRPFLPRLLGCRAGLRSVTMHKDGRTIATGGADGVPRLWSLESATPVREFPARGSSISRLRFDASGRRLLVLADDPQIEVWDTDGSALSKVLHAHAARVTEAWFLADGARLVSIGEDGKAIVWDLTAGAPIRTMQNGPAPLRCGALHPSKPWLVVGTADRAVLVWNLDSGELIKSLRYFAEAEDWRTNPMHQVRGVSFVGDSGRITASYVNDLLISWNMLQNWSQSVIQDDRFGGALRFDPVTGCLLAADFSFGRLALAKGPVCRPLTISGHGAHANKVSALEVQPAGGRAVSAGLDGQAWFWDLVRAEPIFGIRSDCAIVDATFSSDGRWLVTAALDGTVKCWPTNPAAAARAYLVTRAEQSPR